MSYPSVTAVRPRVALMLSLFVLLAISSTHPAAAAAQPRYISHGGAAASEYIVGLPDTADVNAVAVALEREYAVKVIRKFTAAMSGLHVHASEAVAKKLASDARVAYVEENAWIQLTAGPDSKVTLPVDAAPHIYGPGWSLHRISQREPLVRNPDGIDPAGAYSFRDDGAGILAYVFDSGVRADHPEFGSRVQTGYDTFNPATATDPDGDPTLAHAPCPIGNDTVAPIDTCPAGDACRDGAHGTVSASLLGGGTFGVAPGVTIVPVRVVDCANAGTIANVIEGLEWIVRHHLPLPNAAGFNGAVINMSIQHTVATAGDVLSLRAALARVIDRGAVVFTGAGNADADACRGYPSAFAYGNGDFGPHVISASGVDGTDTRRCDSVTGDDNGIGIPCTGPQFGRGRCVDIFAPAVDIRAAALREDPQNPTRPMRLIARNGTSWASPQVAGAGARLLAERAGMADRRLYRSDSAGETSDNVWRALRDNATLGVVQNPGEGSANRLLYIGAIDILEQPRSVVTQGGIGTTPLTITVANPPTGATYQWYRGPFAAPTKIDQATSRTYHAPAGERASYWVRVTYPHEPAPLTVDSVLATVTPCTLVTAAPGISANMAGDGSWTLQVPLDPDATAYEWYVGAPGDISQRVDTTEVPQLTVTPRSTTDYWARVTYGNCGSIDSSNYATAAVCLPPTIVRPPVDHVSGTRPENGVYTHRPYTVDVEATGTNITYQWSRMENGAPVEIPGATRQSLTLFPADGLQQTVFVRVISLCGDEPERQSAPATVSWEECAVSHASAGNPNVRFDTRDAAPLRISDTTVSVVFVPLGRSVALTVQPVPFAGQTIGSTVTTWQDTLDHFLGSGRTYYVPNITNTARSLRVQIEEASAAACTVRPLVTFAACGDPLIETFPVSDGNGSATLRVRTGLTDAIVEWWSGGHDSATRLQALPPEANGQSTVALPPGTTRYWARVSAQMQCRLGNIAEANRTTEDTPVYNVETCNPAQMRDPFNGLPVNVRDGVIWNVPRGGGVALGSTDPDARLIDRGIAQSRSYFARDVYTDRQITVESPAGCFSGTVTLHPVEGCRPLIQNAPASTAVPLQSKATLSVIVDPMYAGTATIQWWDGAHDTSGQPIAENVTSIEGEPNHAYWVRVIGTCGTNRLVQDSPLAFVSCSNCRSRPIRRGAIIVGNTATTHALVDQDTSPITMKVPSEHVGDGHRHEWRTNTNYSVSETPLATGATLSRGGAASPTSTGTYWVRTITPTGSEMESYVTHIERRLQLEPGQIRIALEVTPSTRVIPAQGLVRFKPELPLNACNVKYKWWQAPVGPNQQGVPAQDADSDPSRLDIVDLRDDATFWLEATWDELANDTCPNTAGGQKNGISDRVQITVLCEPAATIGLVTQPIDRHLAKDEMIAFSAFGLGKLLTYTWYYGEIDDRSTSFAIGSGIYKSFRADTDVWVEAVDACGNTAAAGMKVWVCKPTIATQPQDLIRRFDQPKQLTAAATPAQAGQEVNYQWFRSSATEPWTEIAGATNPTLDVNEPNTASYYCRVTSECSDGEEPAVVTRTATVEVCQKPTIVWTTYSQHVRRTELQTLYVEATGKDLTYQWYRGPKNGAHEAITDGTGHSVTLTVQDTTTFWVRVFSQAECHMDSAEFTLTVDSKPDLTNPVATPPVVLSGGTSTLSVTATPTSSAPLTFQWMKITELGYTGVGTDSATYVTEPLTAPTTYIVRVTSGLLEWVQSPEITVSICAFPATINGAPDAQISAGTMHVLALPIEPAEGDMITWYRGASGDTTNPLGPAGHTIYAGVNPTVTTQYWAKIERGGCTTSTNTTTVNVCVPTPVAQPQPGSIVAGQSHTMTFVTGGTDAPQTYQWYAGEPGDTRYPVVDATSATLTFSPAATGTWFCRATSNCGRFIDSHAVQVAVCNPPTITNVSNASIAPGQTGNVAVYATGASLSYQWYRGNTGDVSNPIPGATMPTLSASPAATTTYWARVTSNGGCWTDSAVATINVCVPATISTEPADVLIRTGQTATLSVTASGASAYQWFRGSDSSPIAEATGATYTTPVLNEDAAYFVRVFNGLCVTQSRTAAVTACALSVSTSGAQIARSQSTTLTAGVAGARSQELYYTWYVGASGNISQVLTAGPGLQSVMVSPSATTSYWVRVNDGTCTADSNTAVVEVCRPAIATQPSNTSISSGATASLTVAADIAPVTYQWYAGASGVTSSPVSGATGATLNASPSTTTSYWARVTGNCGYVNSNAAQVCVRPVITNTEGASIAPGSTATIRVTATGGSLSYQWYVGSTGTTTTPIGGNFSSLNVNPTTTTNYWVRVTSAGSCSTDSPTVTVSVCTVPSISTQPANVTINNGQSASLSVAASPATSYQWYRGTSGDMSAPVGAGVSFNTGALSADTSYWVRAINGLCSTNSNAATVTVCHLGVSVNGAQTAVSQSTVLTAGVSNQRSQELYYTWYVGASGNTAQVYTAGPGLASISVSPAATTSYWAKVSDGTCTANSNTATVNVCIPRITTHPAGGVIAPGGSRTLTAASDLPGATYQWYIGASGTGTPISGATGASYTAAPSSTTNYWVRVTGSCGVSVNSNTANVKVCAPPTVTANPTNFSLADGQQVTMAVNASGSNLTYQWYWGASGNTSEPLHGYTASSITGPVQISGGTTQQFWCRVTSDGLCPANGPTITLDICRTPTITSNPASVVISSGQSTTLSVAATTTAGTVTYQWYRGGSGDMSSPVSGATSASFNTGALTADAQYWVRVTRGACSANSASATVTVCGGTVGVGDVLAAANQGVTLTANYYNPRTSEPYYTWYAGASGNTSTPIATGVNQSSIYLTASATAQFWVRVTDGGCAANSNTATIHVCIPTITSQPSNALITNGSSTTLTVGTTGAGLSYQWYQGAVGVTSSPVGTNSPTVTVGPSSTTSYWVRVFGCGGTAVNSSAATVTVCYPPAISGIVADPPVQPNQLTGIRVNATGTNLSYQWYRGASGNTSQPVGTNSSTYTFYPNQSDYYWVRVSSSCGSVDSASTMVHVYPVITTQPQSASVPSGSRVTLTVAASGTYLSYQWYRDGVAVPGATSPSYTTPALTQQADYFVYVTSGTTGARASDHAIISICQGPSVWFGSQWFNGNCWTLSVSPSDYGAMELAYDWYEGQSGDMSKPLGRGSYYKMICTDVKKYYWVRVWNPELNCYTDTPTASVPPW